MLSVFLPLFIYNLGGHSLVDYDEAWYAKIASNILRDKNPIILTFNGEKFIEHPPLGFNIMALSIAIFGHNEFAARLPSAILAFGCIVTLFLIGRDLFNRYIGLASASILASCIWFVYRARTADLDSILLFFYLLTYYFAIKSLRNSIWLYACFLSLLAALLIKSMIVLTIVLPILILFKIKGFKYRKREFTSPILFFILLALLTFSAMLIVNNFDTAFAKRYLLIGFKLNGTQQINFLDIPGSITMQYLHFGVRKWFYPFAFAFFASVIFIKKEKILLSIYAWVLILLFGFLSNAKTEIWHLIPVYPPLALLAAYFSYKVKDVVFKLIADNKKIWYKLSNAAYLIMFFSVASFQIFLFRDEIKFFGREISPIAYLAQKARDYPQDLYLDTEVAVPAAASFYSGKNVTVFRLEAGNNSLPSLLTGEARQLILITETWKLNLDNIPTESYEVLAEKDGHVLIRPTKT